MIKLDKRTNNTIFITKLLMKLVFLYSKTLDMDESLLQSNYEKLPENTVQET